MGRGIIYFLNKTSSLYAVLGFVLLRVSYRYAGASVSMAHSLFYHGRQPRNQTPANEIPLSHKLC